MRPLPLDEVNSGPAVGGKARGLALLHRSGFRVPETWVVPAGDASPDLTDFTAPETWAVRSSATVEDDARYSYAGLFRTELGVATQDLPGAIARVAASGEAERVRAYQARLGLPAEPARVAVILQRYERPLESGVWIGRNLEAGRLEWGAAPAEEWTTETEGGLVGRACLGVQRALGYAVDLELALLESGLTWVQCRPVTRAVPPVPAEPAGPGVLTGVPAAAGVATGTVVCLRDPADPAWRPGSVLVTADTDPGWVPLMVEAAAVVTETGGSLSHAAILAREIGVPCVAGVRDALSRLRTGMAVEVDGSRGVVTASADR